MSNIKGCCAYNLFVKGTVSGALQMLLIGLYNFFAF